MLVSEWIKLWDSLNTTTIPTYYYYNHNKLMKYKLYDINSTINSIQIKCSTEELKEYDINIYHETLDNSSFNYDQDQFYNKLHLELPESSVVYTLHIYII